MNHPLIMHKISMLRSEKTTVKDFRELVNEIALLMGYEATRDLDMVERPVKTPITETNGKFISKQVALVPVLRAGLGMVDIGLYRVPESHVPV